MARRSRQQVTPPTAAAAAAAAETHVEHDLHQLRLVHRYDTTQLRAKMPWYRNSFEDTAPPFTEVLQEPLEMDPPLVIPKDLRPLGEKRRYLRTVQLIADPLPAAALQQTATALDENERVVPFEDSLRRGDRAAAGRYALQKANSHAAVPGVGRTPWRSSPTAKGKAQQRQRALTPNSENRAETRETAMVNGVDRYDEISEAEGEEDEEAHARPRERAKSGKLQSKPTRLLDPLQAAPSFGARMAGHQQGRRAAQQISLEEMEELPNYKAYFGARAKQSFFAQYQNLHSRPYLFVEGDLSERDDSTSAGNSPPSTESKYVPVYPSSKELKRIAQELAPYGAAVAAGTVSEPTNGGIKKAPEDAEIPTRDKLSPRSLFLTSCVSKPQLAVPFMLRKRMTKVFDFSFQSLGDEFIVEFAKCIVQDLPFVEDILVRDNRLSDAGLNALLEAISEGSSMLNLQRLDISQNEMGSASARTLRTYIASSHCTLTTLLVDNADIDDRECAAFMSAFEKNLSIKHLCLSRNCIGEMEHLNVVQPDFTTGGEAIASMLHKNLVLVHLDLSWNYLRLESSVMLANSMRENYTIKELNLSYNACGDAGAVAFGEALRFNQSLEVLDLSYNSIGCKGALVLANAIRMNRTLRSLQLNGNNIGREGGQFVLSALCENQTESGCDVGLRACNLSSSMLPSFQGPPVAPVNSGAGILASGSSGDSSASVSLPVYSLGSSWIFNPKEPTGRYVLNMSEAYEKMVAMELVRLAKYKKGCKFVKVEHSPGGSARAASAVNRSRARHPSGSTKKTVQLVRREQGVKQAQPSQPAFKRKAGVAQVVKDDVDDENSLEMRGLDALFANIDRDKSGSIDKAEVMTVLNRIGLFPRMDNLSSMLEMHDANSSGFLEAREFSGFLFHAVFQLIDVDKSGKIDADEMEDAFKMLGMTSYDQKEIAAAIATYDISGDGEIEESEFIEFLKDSLLEKIKLQICSAGDTGDKRVPVTLVDTSTQRPWVVPDSGRLEIEFLYEREAFASNDEAHRLCKISQFGIEQLIRNITQQAASKSEQDELFHVAIHDSDIRFTASQAFQVLEACGYMRSPDERKRIETIALILPQMLTVKEAQVLVSRTLTTKQRYRLKTELGSAYSVVLGNPTAHYSFDLGKPKDRLALTKIAEVAQSEKLFSRFKSGRADTSQHGNWENFRNEELDGQKIVLTSAFFLVLPRRGKLSFDYVSTARPKRGTVPMSARRFEQLIEELKEDVERRSAGASAKRSSTKNARGDQQISASSGRDELSSRPPAGSESLRRSSTVVTNALKKLVAHKPSPASGEQRRSSWQLVLAQATSKFLLAGETREDVGMKLVQIESAVCDRWLACEQAVAIVACMPNAFHARSETARLLFSRVIDLGSFGRLLDALAPEDRTVCAKALGWLNVCNPMEPERCYALDLSVWDEREMTKLLVELAIAEPGENWINQSFAATRGEPGIPGWKLPVRWEKDDGKEGGVNRSGFLEVEYYSEPDAKVPAFRRTLLKRTLCGTRQYCL